VRQNLDVTYTIVWSLALANVVGAGLCVLLSPQIARITKIRFTIFGPVPVHDHHLCSFPVASDADASVEGIDMTDHVFDLLARATAQEGPEACFALLGDANMNFATRLAKAGVRMIHERHEHCAVAAAMAHARKTGDVGLATVTCGPGLT